MVILVNMADDYHEDSETGGAIATSEDISASKKGRDGDKDNLLDTGGGTLFKRKNVMSDPEVGMISDQERASNPHDVIDNEGILLMIYTQNIRIKN